MEVVMKKTVLYLLAAALVLCTGYAAFAIHEVIPSETVIPEPGADAEKINYYIIKYKPYTTWQLWPDKGRLYPATQPHGAFLTTFVNGEAYASIRDKKGGMADGSMIAKESYDADKKFLNLLVMYKIKGYNPTAGDWFFAKYAPDGKVLAAGRVEGCITCHAKKKDNDFLFTGPMK
jgi:hypothetical protein